MALDKVDAWAHLAPEVTITNLETPLFGYYRVPGANTVDPSSPLGLSVFANAIAELKAIDIAVSRKNTEIEDSKHITFVGQQLIQNAQNSTSRLLVRRLSSTPRTETCSCRALLRRWALA